MEWRTDRRLEKENVPFVSFSKDVWSLCGAPSVIKTNQKESTIKLPFILCYLKNELKTRSRKCCSGHVCEGDLWDVKRGAYNAYSIPSSLPHTECTQKIPFSKQNMCPPVNLNALSSCQACFLMKKTRAGIITKNSLPVVHTGCESENRTLK